jgi:hypothetical protein
MIRMVWVSMGANSKSKTVIHEICARRRPRCWVGCKLIRKKDVRPPRNCVHLDKIPLLKPRLGTNKRWV